MVAMVTVTGSATISYEATKVAPASLEVASRIVLPAARHAAYRPPLASWKRSLQLWQLDRSPVASTTGAPKPDPLNFRTSQVSGNVCAPLPVVMANRPLRPPASAASSPWPTVVGPLQLAASLRFGPVAVQKPKPDGAPPFGISQAMATGVVPSNAAEKL